MASGLSLKVTRPAAEAGYGPLLGLFEGIMYFAIPACMYLNFRRLDWLILGQFLSASAVLFLLIG